MYGLGIWGYCVIGEELLMTLFIITIGWWRNDEQFIGIIIVVLLLLMTNVCEQAITTDY